ncbi:MAG TPA: gamma-glutamylcyclotransferase [Kofleriaceae bacterium]|nr:gamma-glutamylcyclotransferase [Kofleriaceae bacterium]
MPDRRRTTGSFEAAKTTGSEEALNRLFVYGSLRSGQTARSLIANSVARSTPATMAGNLYMFPMGYPAFVEGNGRVVGELLWLDDLAATLAMLDAYEGADFVRLVRQVTLPSGIGSDGFPHHRAEGLQVWAWVYSLAVPDTVAYAEQIPDGDWVRHWKEHLG